VYIFLGRSYRHPDPCRSQLLFATSISSPAPMSPVFATSFFHRNGKVWEFIPVVECRVCRAPLYRIAFQPQDFLMLTPNISPNRRSQFSVAFAIVSSRFTHTPGICALTPNLFLFELVMGYVFLPPKPQGLTGAPGISSRIDCPSLLKPKSLSHWSKKY